MAAVGFDLAPDIDLEIEADETRAHSRRPSAHRLLHGMGDFDRLGVAAVGCKQ